MPSSPTRGSPAPATSRNRGVASAPPQAMESAVHFAGIMLKSTAHDRESASSAAPSSTHAATSTGSMASPPTTPLQQSAERANAGTSSASEPGSTSLLSRSNTASGLRRQNNSATLAVTRDTIRQATPTSTASNDKSGNAGENTM